MNPLRCATVRAIRPTQSAQRVRLAFAKVHCADLDWHCVGLRIGRHGGLDAPVVRIAADLTELVLGVR